MTDFGFIFGPPEGVDNMVILIFSILVSKLKREDLPLFSFQKSTYGLCEPYISVRISYFIWTSWSRIGATRLLGTKSQLLTTPAHRRPIRSNPIMFFMFVQV